ncbi:hypothetical protein ACEZDB_05560 [Streptacidiphilus sp. N1-3]|uniref:Uncharacterized protein n=1 Tax=Streptacidiphilus alkalitolerans TaxID=3342712 RepID=A0ABV6WVQ0_9ACTN
MDAQDTKSAQRLSQAYGGAKAVVQHYADSEVAEIVILDAVSASSPQPYVPYEDAAQLGMAVPPDQLVQVGQVACVVYNQGTAAGQKPTAESVVVNYCQRTGSGLTVQLRASGDLQHQPQQMAALVEKAWTALS